VSYNVGPNCITMTSHFNHDIKHRTKFHYFINIHLTTKKHMLSNSPLVKQIKKDFLSYRLKATPANQCVWVVEREANKESVDM